MSNVNDAPLPKDTLFVPVGDGGVDPESVRQEVIEVLSTYYDLGEIVEVWLITGGFINWSLGARFKRNGITTDYLVRKYNREATEAAVQFEHRLVDHIIEKGFNIVAPVIRAIDGNSYVISPDTQFGDPRLFAVYGFLCGESKYSWCFDIDVTDKELVSLARTLASYHASVGAYIPPYISQPTGLYQGDGILPPIMEHLIRLPEIYSGLAARVEDNVFGRYLKENIDLINRCVRESTISESQLSYLPKLVTHSDFHPGNVKYRDGEVVGLFDFDYARYDYRMFDIGHALHFVCFSWEPETDGEFWIDKMERFVSEYQRASRELPGAEPLSEAELAYIIPFLHAGNIFTLDWDIQDYFAEPGRDPEEYFTFLRHHVQSMKSIYDHQEAIRSLVIKATK